MAIARRWCFTLNNPREDEHVHTLWSTWTGLRFAVCQREQGESGTDHYQGYTEWSGTMRLAAVKRLLPRAHWEPAKGTQAHNVDYCTKADGRKDGPWTHGDRTQAGQGKRNDLTEIKRMLDSGSSVNDIADTHFEQWLNHSESFHKYKRIKTEKRCWYPTVIVICGPTGTGKSRLARELCSTVDTYWWSNDKWWDAYDGQKAVILDEFKGGLRWEFLLRLLDNNPFAVEVKGGTREFTSRAIIITSNERPEEWYDPIKFGRHFPALFRRIHMMLWLQDGATTFQLGYKPDALYERQPEEDSME